MSQEKDAPLCARVFDRLVEEGDVGAERDLAEHLGSCVTCFRTMTELRDAPRVAEALRGTPASAIQPAPSERFWEELAVRTTAAAAAALRGPGPVDLRPAPRGPGPVDVRPAPVFHGRAYRWSVSARARVAVVATAVAAAAAFAVVARRPPVERSAQEPALRAPGLVASVARAGADDEAGEVAAEVADLDGTALRRLLDRLSTHAPAVLTSVGGGDPGESGEASDTLGDDDRRVNDELADLDGTALRRVASSLGGSSL